MIIKAVNKELKNKRAAIQFLCANMDNGIVYMELCKILNNIPYTKEKQGKGVVYTYRNIDNTQNCSIKRQHINNSYVYTVQISISININ